jgi:hypothetical protein
MRSTDDANIVHRDLQGSHCEGAHSLASYATKPKSKAPQSHPRSCFFRPHARFLLLACRWEPWWGLWHGISTDFFLRGVLGTWRR